MNDSKSSVTTPFHAFTLPDWQRHYLSAPDSLRSSLSMVLASLNPQDTAWLYLATPDQLEAQFAHLEQLRRDANGSLASLPLFGVPFAVKDNIDIGGWPTSAACPEFTYVAQDDATVVANLRAKGAIVVGKTNLDQFATGLVGTRSPRGAVRNTFNPDYVSGGSSSGSASVLARGLVAFSLGTDTAGSGRVPAGFNNIVGLKPTKGWLSNKGVVPACRLNDAVSVFALTVEDAQAVAHAAGGYDAADAYSRANPHTAPAAMSAHPRFAVPNSLEFFGDALAEFEFEQSLERLSASGVTLVPIDFTPFRELAEQLYYGAWVAERTVAVGKIFEETPEVMDPTVRGIVANGLNYSACDAWRAEYLRAELARKINLALEGFDALIVPTSPTIRTLEEMAQEPVRYNSQFGTYTNFTNLADLSALALPASIRADGLPSGITLIAPAWHDDALAAFGRQWQRSLPLPLGATGRELSANALMHAIPTSKDHVRVAVVGAHLTGMPLNFQLTQRKAVRVEQTTTAANYKLFALANTQPPKPGLVRAEGGSAIIVELWDIPLARFGEFVAEIPAPLGIGSLQLADGRTVKGFICEPWAISDATDITHFGGWRSYISHLASLNHA
ncbi:MAG: allophanate hydrolase [Ewingella americana]|jgi:allophanate hydrolase|uniref:allophanate hydrolase n=1 Tax=Ewingella americana TaxID=41202 RepID=UPI00242B15DF|nr:allophanate hydrolase [Ewingella americana]MCI1679871.1 allophanate hydrolase [Ewingella americana]MCI1855555.1 allophanate hydrolase [Ewingella americana]MCI1862951.1 allophanate hydrolase [Ewingella americana]MCI2140625.1 allophanate hydrolase [Ewingella americana]MCI2166250.1 allophanate hydrolase [Ewingella americana]